MTTRLAPLLLPPLLALSGSAYLYARMPRAAAIEGLEAAAGAEATLFAEAPMLGSPVAIDVDARGRVWVAQRRGGIRILEDDDGDGRADAGSAFYEGPEVEGATGIAVLGKRVVVSAQGKILLFTDTDGDDRADDERAVFVREARGTVPTIRAFVLGPDGRLYFNTGGGGGALRDAQGKVAVERAGRPVVPDSGNFRQGMTFRVSQDFTRLEVVGHDFRDPTELALDSYGNVWQGDAGEEGSRAARLNYLMEFGNYGYADEASGASWRAPRAGLERAIPLQHWHQNDPGVVPNLLLTGSGSPGGMTVYEGTLLPAPFRDVLLQTDADRGVLRAYPTARSGAGYTARMVTLLRATTGRGFQPVDVAAAPDGSLLVADSGQGRIIRLAPPGAAYTVPALDVSTPEGAARALRNPAPAARFEAYEALAGLGAAGDAALWELWADANPRMRARALWLLAQRGTRGTRYLEEALRDRNPDIRVTGLRAARLVNRNVLTYARRLVNDSSAQVRREVAIALRYEDRPAVQQIWIQLARQYDGADRWYLEALGIAADGRWKEFLPAWRTALRDRWDEKPGRDIVWRARPDTVPTLLTTLISRPSLSAEERMRLLRSLDFYRGPTREGALLEVMAEQAVDLETTALALLALDSTRTRMTAPLARALDRTLNGSRDSRYFVDLARRYNSRGYAVALSQLALEKAGSDAGIEAARLAAGWLGLAPFRQAASAQDTAVARRALLLLGELGTGEANELVRETALAGGRPLSVRRAAVLALGRTDPGRLLQLVESGALPAELREAAAITLRASPRADLRAAAARLLPLPAGRSSAGEPLPPISELASRGGDVARGRVAFARACAACHQVDATGPGFGPALSGIGARLGKSALYDAILEPSASVAPGHEGYLVSFQDGRELAGILLDATAAELSLMAPSGAVSRFPRGDVAMILPTDESLMPDGLESTLSEAELVDLVEYLSALRPTGR